VVDGELARALTTRRWALGLAAAIAALRLLVESSIGSALLGFPLFALGVVAITFALTYVSPAASRWAVRIALVLMMVNIAIGTAAPPPRLATVQPIIIYQLFPLFALLLDGVVGIVMVVVVALAGLAWVSMTVRFAGTLAPVVLSNVTLSLLVVAMVSAVESRAARALRERAREVAAGHTQTLTDVEALNRLLFSDFRAILERLGQMLATSTPDRGLVREATAELRGLLVRGRQVVLSGADEPAPERLALTEFELRRRGVKVVAGLLIAAAGLAALRNASAGGPILSNMLLVAVAIAVVVRGRRSRSLAFDVAMAVACALAHALALREWGYAPDAPLLAAMPGLSFAFYWLLGIEALVVWLVCTLVSIIIAMAVAGTSPVAPVAAALVFTLAGVGACALYWRNLRVALRDVDEEARAAQAATRERRRLTTTFFHDQANLMVALEAVAHLGDADPEVLGELAALVARMRAHLDATSELPGGLRPAAARPITVRELFDGVALLFREPLATKAQHLVCEGDDGLRLYAVPAVLLDSVLSNLVSNAIKFTPGGGTIRLRAERAGPDVVLRVGDEGPGLPAEVVAGLGAAERLPSRPGSAGEVGNGYGLVLAQRTTRQMGGVLELGTPARGTEVIIRFPGAPTAAEIP
jgi:signal transduction histidine kinase